MFETTKHRIMSTLEFAKNHGLFMLIDPGLSYFNIFESYQGDVRWVFRITQVISGSPSKVLSASHPVELTLQLGLFDAKRCPGASRVGLPGSLV